MEQKKYTKDDLITLSEAAKLLGLNCFRRVNALVKNGKLKAYKLPLYDRKKFVAREEVNALMEVQEVNYGS
jgi:hypothetical protein